jgi:hypothetical protein
MHRRVMHRVMGSEIDCIEVRVSGLGLRISHDVRCQ